MKFPKLFVPEFFAWNIRSKVIYSPGCRENVGGEFDRLGASKAMMLTDKGLVKAGIAEKVKKGFSDSNTKLVEVYDEIEQDNNVDIINKIYQKAKERGIDGILAVGGGSVIDCAKCVNAMLGTEFDDFYKLAEVGLTEAKPLGPHVCIPTTAGTGAEVTYGAMYYNPRKRVKVPFVHEFGPPDVALLDPELTLTLPPKITAFTGMDALTHAIEGTVSTSANPICDALELHAIKLIVQYLPVAVKDGSNIEARGGMLVASNLTGLCMTSALLGAVHATSHALGGKYRIPHGLGNAIMLPHVMEYNLDFATERYALVAEAMGEDISGLSSKEAAKKAVDAVKKLKENIGIIDTLSDFGVDKATDEEFAELVNAALYDGTMVSNPRPANEDDIKELYKKAM